MDNSPTGRGFALRNAPLGVQLATTAAAGAGLGHILPRLAHEIPELLRDMRGQKPGPPMKLLRPRHMAIGSAAGVATGLLARALRKKENTMSIQKIAEDLGLVKRSALQKSSSTAAARWAVRQRAAGTDPRALIHPAVKRIHQRTPLHEFSSDAERLTSQRYGEGLRRHNRTAQNLVDEGNTASRLRDEVWAATRGRGEMPDPTRLTAARRSLREAATLRDSGRPLNLSGPLGPLPG